MRARPVGKPPPTDDEVAEAKRIKDAKRAGTMTDTDYDSLVGLIGKYSATGNLRSLRRLLRCRLWRSLIRRRMMGRSRLRRRLRDES